MTHTLESLKKILDEGGTIIKGRRKFCKKDGQYHFDSGFGNSGPCSTLFLEYALSKGEWSELKAEPTDEEKRLMLQGLAMRQDRMRGIPKEAAYTPSTITVPIDQWNALNKELGELKAKSHKSFIDEALDAIKAKMDDIYKEHGIVPLMSQSQTLDPAAEYGASFDEPLPAPVRNTEEIKKGWDEFSIAMYRKAVEDIGWKFTSNEASARDQLSKEPFTSLAKYYKDTHPPIGPDNPETLHLPRFTRSGNHGGN